jgi:hypothetical protein
MRKPPKDCERLRSFSIVQGERACTGVAVGLYSLHEGLYHVVRRLVIFPRGVEQRQWDTDRPWNEALGVLAAARGGYCICIWMSELLLLLLARDVMAYRAGTAGLLRTLGGR